MFGVWISLPNAEISENPRSSATITRKFGLEDILRYAVLAGKSVKLEILSIQFTDSHQSAYNILMMLQHQTDLGQDHPESKEHALHASVPQIKAESLASLAATPALAGLRV